MVKVNQIWGGVQDNARNFAHKGLQLSSKALEATSNAIQNLRAEVDKRAQTLTSDNTQAADTAATKTTGKSTPKKASTKAP